MAAVLGGLEEIPSTVKKGLGRKQSVNKSLGFAGFKRGGRVARAVMSAQAWNVPFILSIEGTGLASLTFTGGSQSGKTEHEAQAFYIGRGWHHIGFQVPYNFY